MLKYMERILAGKRCAVIKSPSNKALVWDATPRCGLRPTAYR